MTQLTCDTIAKWVKRFAYGVMLSLAVFVRLLVIEAARVSEVDESNQPDPGSATARRGAA